MAHNCMHTQSIQSPEEERWVLRTDLNDALEERVRESRVDCSRVMVLDSMAHIPLQTICHLKHGRQIMG